MMSIYFKVFYQRIKYFLFHKRYRVNFELDILPNFKLIKILFSNYHHRSFKYAIYLRGSKLLFAKIWMYPYKNYDYYSLIHSLNVNKMLCSLSIDINLNFPQTFGIYHYRETLIYFTEYLNGNTISKFNLIHKIGIYKLIIQNLKKINLDLCRDSKPEILHLPYLLIHIPLLIIISFVRFPKQWKLFVRITSVFVSNFNLLLKKYNYSYVHRSLEDNNILIHDGNTYLIDFQLGIFSHPYIELANTLFFNWKDSEFSDEFKKFIINPEISNSDESKKLFQLLALYTGLQQLVLGYYDVNICFLFLSSFLNKNNKLSLFENVSFAIFSALSFFQPETRNNYILCYHSIGDDEWRFSTKIFNFKKQVEYLSKFYKFCKLDDLFSSSKSGLIALTFDDGYENVYKNAFPILKDRGIPATLFIVGDKERVNRNELNNSLPLLNNKQIKKLRENGWEIGFHTKTHSNLGSLSEKEIVEEIQTSKRRTESALGLNLDYLAYPRGIFNKDVERVAKKAGYKAAFTVKAGCFKPTNKFQTARIPIEGRIPLNAFKGMLSIQGIFLYQIFLRFLEIKENFISEFVQKNRHMLLEKNYFRHIFSVWQ